MQCVHQRAPQGPAMIKQNSCASVLSHRASTRARRIGASSSRLIISFAVAVCRHPKGSKYTRRAHLHTDDTPGVCLLFSAIERPDAHCDLDALCRHHLRPPQGGSDGRATRTSPCASAEIGYSGAAERVC
eukprot:scaffold1047_cov112-Isochrysis_galbana.AAC.5